MRVGEFDVDHDCGNAVMMYVCVLKIGITWDQNGAQFEWPLTDETRKPLL